MIQQVKKKIIENNGRIVEETSSRLRATFSETDIEKAIKVFFDLPKKLKENAVLDGGYKLTVFF